MIHLRVTVRVVSAMLFAAVICMTIAGCAAVEAAQRISAGQSPSQPRYSHMDEVESWYREDAEQGDVVAMYNLGMALRSHWMIDYKKPFNPFQTGSIRYLPRVHTPSREDPTANVQYAMVYAFKDGAAHRDAERVRRHDEESIKWLRKSADAGHVPAMYQLGISFATGRDGVLRQGSGKDSDLRQVRRTRGVHPVSVGSQRQDLPDGLNVVEAAQWLGKASEDGNAPARRDLVTLLHRSDIDDRGAEAILAQLHEAAEAGDATTVAHLVTIYQDGVGVVAQNPAEAERWATTQRDAAEATRAARRATRDAFDDPDEGLLDAMRQHQLQSRLDLLRNIETVGVADADGIVGSLRNLDSWWSEGQREMAARLGNMSAEATYQFETGETMSRFLGQQVEWTFQPVMTPRLIDSAEVEGKTVQVIAVSGGFGHQPNTSVEPHDLTNAEIIQGGINILQLYRKPMRVTGDGENQGLWPLYDPDFGSGTPRFEREVAVENPIGEIRLIVGEDIRAEDIPHITRNSQVVVTATIAHASVQKRFMPYPVQPRQFRGDQYREQLEHIQREREVVQKRRDIEHAPMTLIVILSNITVKDIR